MHSEDSRLTIAIDACRKGFVAIGVFSLFINLLMLTAPLYMLQLFDRVLTSRSTDTLIVLMLIAGVALLVMTILEIVRGAMLVRLGTWLEWRLAGDVLNADVFANLKDSAQRSDQGLRDLSTVRGVLSGPALYPILDAPWTPIFLGVMFLLHPTLGWISTAGAIILFGLAIFNERWTRSNQSDMSGAFMSAQNKADDAVRNADAIGAMGMMPNFMSSWYPDYSRALDNQQAVGQGSIAITAASKLVRLFLQISLLSSGAWLVLNNEMGPGAMIAGSILMSRALAPVEQAMGSWKTVLAARAAFARLQDLLDSMPQNPNAMPIPNPKGDVSVENIGYRYPEGEKPALARIDFELADGETLGIMGPTASGKSTLSRLISGNLKPTTGHVRLSGVADRRVRHDDIADHAARHVLEHGRVQQINIRRDIVLEGEVVFVELVVTNTIQGKRNAICKGNNRIPANLAQAVRDHVRKVDKTGVLQIDDIFAASARLEVVDNVAAVAETALYEIVTAAAADNVVAGTGVNQIVAVVAAQIIVAGAAVQNIVVVTAAQNVVAVARV